MPEDFIIDDAMAESIREDMLVFIDNLPNTDWGCYHCEKIVNTSDVTLFTKGPANRVPERHYVICPHCGVDAMVPHINCYVDSKGIRAGKKLLKNLHEYYFSTDKSTPAVTVEVPESFMDRFTKVI